MSASAQLEDLIATARNCRICVEHPVGKPLPHEPKPVFVVSARAKILIAGQAPGTRVHESGIPFQDRSGDTLRKWLGINHDTFYDPTKFAILPMGFCFPGQDKNGSDLPPRRECAPAWRQQFLDFMPQLRLLLAIGQYSQAWHLGSRRRKTLTETVADWRDIYEQSERPKIIPLPHPSWRSTIWLRRNPWFEAELLPKLRELVKELTA